MERSAKMGALTDDMKRLRGDVEALRQARGALMQDLALETRQRRDEVSMMQAGFRKTHAELSKRAKAERKAFIMGQKRAVAHLRKVFANDLAGAGRAWFGARA
jgi:hypothetical protein